MIKLPDTPGIIIVPLPIAPMNNIIMINKALIVSPFSVPAFNKVIPIKTPKQTKNVI